MNLINFKEAYSWAKDIDLRSDNRPAVLLGNGFSISYDPDKYSYKAILQQSKKEVEKLPNASLLFAKSGSEDFEKIILELESIAEGLESIQPKNQKELIAELRNEADRMKHILAESIAKLHNNRPSEIADDAFKKCRDFLKQFSNYYTTNYDFLLYWACMHNSENDSILSKDGFYERNSDSEYVSWDGLGNSGTQTLFYLHGALHLFKDTKDGSIRKITYSRTKKRLIDQVRNQLHQGKYPLVVAEGSSNSKRKRVNESPFLHRGYRSLATLKRSLIVYGLSFSSNDSHIGDAIAKSSISKMAVSIYGDRNSDENINLKNSIEDIIKKRDEIIKSNQKRKKLELEVKYFDASTADIWK